MGADTSVSYGEASSATTPASTRKRKRVGAAANPSLHSCDALTSKGTASTLDALNNAQPATPTKKARAPKPTSTPSEKRLRRFRPQPPKSFQETYHRSTTQRFFVLSRTRHDGNDGSPEETVELTGSTGNIYTVTIAQQPRCDCPHTREGNQCKHVVYVLARVLHARFDYVYQLALLSVELREIFEAAPPIVDDAAGGVRGAETSGKRKPVEGDCPICFCEMEADAGGGGGEPVVWCRAACGQNVHKGCFETWAATKRRQAAGGGGSGEVTCPYCRSVWEGDEDMIKAIQKKGKRNAEGYVNVASQLGISTERDYSTYSRWWSGYPSSYRRRYY